MSVLSLLLGRCLIRIETTTKTTRKAVTVTFQVAFAFKPLADTQQTERMFFYFYVSSWKNGGNKTNARKVGFPSEHHSWRVKFIMAGNQDSSDLRKLGRFCPHSGGGKRWLLLAKLHFHFSFNSTFVGF